jgi:hypothetical protein
VSLQTSVALSELCAKSEEKYFKLKYKPTGIVRNVNAMIYFQYKVQLTFRNNNNCSSVTVSVHTVFANKCIDIKLKCRKNRNCETRTAHRYSTLLLWEEDCSRVQYIIVVGRGLLNGTVHYCCEKRTAHRYSTLLL